MASHFRWISYSEIMVESIIKISSRNETLYMHGLHPQNTEKKINRNIVPDTPRATVELM